jgi:hypothetical protein
VSHPPPAGRWAASAPAARPQSSGRPCAGGRSHGSVRRPGAGPAPRSPPASAARAACSWPARDGPSAGGAGGPDLSAPSRIRRGRSGAEGSAAGAGRLFHSSSARCVAGAGGCPPACRVNAVNAPPAGGGSSSSGAGRFQPAINPPAAGRRGMSGESPEPTAGPGSGSRNRARRFGGWNSDSPPGLTATPNGGGGTCGTRRGNGAADPAADPDPAPDAEPTSGAHPPDADPAADPDPPLEADPAPPGVHPAPEADPAPDADPTPDGDPPAGPGGEADLGAAGASAVPPSAAVPV